ncbi:MAG: TRAP transporter large permease [Candidatus Rokubacteria bacterium]|nr:TRAP transporter large permease [Candidatus Rokubacteria bacterium]
MIDPTTLALVSVGLVFALILLGVHIGVALAAVSVLTLWLITGKFSVAVSLLQTTAYSAVMDYVFAVVPLFVLMGLFSTVSGATRELFASAQVVLGRVRGGIGIATVFANAVFAAITGVSVASAAVFSKIALPEMQRLHYDRQFSLGIVAGSAILGMLIPPSVLMIVYGVLTEQAIGKLFIAGILPGLVVTAVLSLGIWAMVLVTARLVGRLEAVRRLDVRTVLRAAVAPWAVLALVVLVMGGIWGGFFTPTEAGAVGAAGGFLLILIKRAPLTLRGLWQVLLDGGQTTASIFLLLICAQMYSRMLTMSGLAGQVTHWVSALPIPPLFIVFGFIIVFMLLGCIIDSTSIILLTIPLMHPIAMKLGYDPLWFAIVAIVAIEIGLLTPPFGMVVFAMRSALGDEVQVEEIFAGALPFILMLGAALAIIIAFPRLSTFLPSLM